ncbi:MAG TPA: trypsin-like peptidase domain-containing protein [Ktedonobacteraceae bacterium]|nr:trypsin-like peptidase domain-containing protein [Ktedonobacteraceae bacterium]
MKDPSTQEEYRASDNGASTQSSPGTNQPSETSDQAQTMPAQTPPPMQPVQPGRSGRGFRAGAILILALVLLLVFGVGLFAGWQFTRSNTSSSSTLQPGRTPVVTVPPLTGTNVGTVRIAVIQKVSPAVVQIDVTTQSGGAIGSGVIIDKRGYIVTNNHVVSGAQSLSVTLYDGSKLTAQLTGTDPADDLAVIKITPPSTGLIVAQLGDSSKLQVGQEVLVIGNPLGITQTVTNGIVSALNRNVSEGQGGATIPNAIQTDAPINPGNSGGALVDLTGNVVGIPTLTAIDPEFNTPANGVGFAIPSNRVAFIVPQIIETGSVTHTGRAVMGVSVTTVDATVQAQDNLAVDHGALIVNMTSNSAAAAAGLKPGDVIVQIDNTPVTDVQSLSDALMSKSPGDTVTVAVYRGSQQLTFHVTLGELQANG